MTRTILLSFLISVSLINLAFISIAQAAESKTVTLDIPSMTCGICPITIREALKKVKGVTEAKTNFSTRTATVTFDPDKTNIESLTKATANSGYPSTLKHKILAPQ